jgi:acetoacetate decarboxylase
MKINDVRRAAYAMPLTNPAFPRGPYRFFDREYLIVTYRTDEDALRAVVPEPLEIVEPIVKYEFIRMPDSTGFGDYTESGQVIPVRFRGEDGVYVHSMYLDDDAAIVGGRELWGFPKKLAKPEITHEGEVIVGPYITESPLRYRDHRLQHRPQTARGSLRRCSSRTPPEGHPAC